jgi:hypothetical protein
MAAPARPSLSSGRQLSSALQVHLQAAGSLDTRYVSSGRRGHGVTGAEWLRRVVCTCCA